VPCGRGIVSACGDRILWVVGLNPAEVQGGSFIKRNVGLPLMSFGGRFVLQGTFSCIRKWWSVIVLLLDNIYSLLAVFLKFSTPVGWFYFLLHITITIINCNSSTSDVGCPSPLGYDPQVPPYASKTLPSSSGITSMSHHSRLLLVVLEF
jgi:hypothetical protein